ncbi:DUF4861 domain-containing protein [Arenibacter sp. F20364]|uniref:DUF4861 domain-containing protein n=1 Tax=Arenibacter sp. F20364 TaxID=2926415 RepID=UPI001FF5CC09|nr:DUF4861 domain-containing protein [Arenibacter sp. F20364]MCK0190864.1 DUF4861 domain-containing protein [Arenibacter sp. F20364]
MKASLYSLSLVWLIAFTSCKKEVEKGQLIQLTNTSEVELLDKPVSIGKKLLSLNDSLVRYPLVLSQTDTIPSQLNDTDMDGQWDELFFVADFRPKESKSITLIWTDKEPIYEPRTSVRFGKRTSVDKAVQPATNETMLANELPKSLGYQQYQTDGPSWENDRVGFRHYLDGRNAKDLFGKKTSSMSPEDVGLDAAGAVEDNYHVMEDWGRDILAVGNSVGLGGYALINETEFMRLGVTVEDSINNVEKTTFHIDVEGPVNSIISYTYNNWKPNNRTYSVKETTSIWPGIYGFKNTVSVSGLTGDEDLAVGLVNINTDHSLGVLDENSKYVVLYTHDKQTYNKEWWLGMALILPKDKYLGFTQAPKTGPLSNSFLAKLKIEDNQPVSYYAIAGWELSDEKFSNETYFTDYLKKLTGQLSAVVEIEVKN